MKQEVRSFNFVCSSHKTDFPILLGSVSSEKSQAGSVYDDNGIFCTLCACTHGYAIGYVLVKEEDNENN